MNEQTTYDVAVVGAGTAGLQAALTLGRMRQRTIVLGNERYRNDPADEMHNFLGHDGESPEVLRAAARADVARYESVAFAEREVARIDGEVGDFRLALADGEELRAARVLLATGVADTLPDIRGLEEIFGNEAAHCPYCHGYEYADTPVAIVGAGPHVPHLARVMDRLASRVVVLTDGAELDEDTATTLKRDERDIVTTSISEVVRSVDGGVTVSLADGSTEELGGMLVKPEWRQAAPFADQLGLEMSPVGAVVVDAFGRTSLPGVYAAGDMAQGPGLPMPMASVLTAASGGLVAASACHMDSLTG